MRRFHVAHRSGGINSICSRRIASMKRSRVVFILVSALSVLLGAAVYADTAATPASPGWLKANMEGEYAAQVTSDAQKLVGVSVDQLMNEMGSTALKSSDGSGGTEYYYEVQLASEPGANEAQVYIDVDSSGKVVKVSVDT
jgi:hypothetical protein